MLGTSTTTILKNASMIDNCEHFFYTYYVVHFPNTYSYPLRFDEDLK